MPRVGYGRYFLVVRLNGREVDCGPFLQVPITLDTLRVSKGLAVGLVYLVDAPHYLLEIGDIFGGRFDVLEQAVHRDPVFSKGMAPRSEAVARSCGF